MANTSMRSPPWASASSRSAPSRRARSRAIRSRASSASRSTRPSINRLGFNNHGVERLLRNLERSSFRGVLGINIGKNLDTPLERAADDYLACLDAVYTRASYVTVNISSPNTEKLRELQSGERLDALLGALMERRGTLARRHGMTRPLLREGGAGPGRGADRIHRRARNRARGRRHHRHQHHRGAARVSRATGWRRRPAG